MNRIIIDFENGDSTVIFDVEHITNDGLDMYITTATQGLYGDTHYEHISYPMYLVQGWSVL